MVDATIIQKRVQRDVDNFFTSINLANKLKAEKTTLLDAIRKQRKEVRKVEAIMKDKPLYSSEVFVSPSNATLTINKAKKAKLVRLLSSIHKTISVNLAQKKLPETVKYCNLPKVKVDVSDQTTRYHTCKNATRRRPVAVFFTIIDHACINAYIIYYEVTGQSLSRRKFLLQFIKKMCCNPPAESAPAPLAVEEVQVPARSIEKGSNVSCSYAETSPAYLATYAT